MGFNLLIHRFLDLPLVKTPTQLSEMVSLTGINIERFLMIEDLSGLALWLILTNV